MASQVARATPAALQTSKGGRQVGLSCTVPGISQVGKKTRAPIPRGCRVAVRRSLGAPDPSLEGIS